MAKADPARRFVIDVPYMLRLSHARLRAWRRCEMEHHYRYYQGLRKKKPATPLFVGTGMHAMIEAQIETGNWLPALANFRKEFTRLFIEERAELGDLPGQIEQIMKGYFKRFEGDDLIYVKRHRGRKTEIPMHVELAPRISFLGRIDAFPADPFGRHWIMDHKSCKTIPDEDARFADLQLLLYVWLAPQLGYPKPDGVIWDYLRKKPPTPPEVLKNGTISKAVKQDTTVETYMKVVEAQHNAGTITKPQVEEYRRFAEETFTGREEKFYRRIYLPTNSDAMVLNVVKDVIADGQQILLRGPEATVRRMDNVKCRSCSYYTLCQAEVRGLDADYIRKTEYEVKEKDDAGQEEVDVGEAEE